MSVRYQHWLLVQKPLLEALFNCWWLKSNSFSNYLYGFVENLLVLTWLKGVSMCLAMKSTKKDISLAKPAMCTFPSQFHAAETRLLPVCRSRPTHCRFFVSCATVQFDVWQIYELLWCRLNTTKLSLHPEGFMGQQNQNAVPGTSDCRELLNYLYR